MRDFLTNLLDRHKGLGEKVLPRARGRFEPDVNAVATFLPQFAQENSHHLMSAVTSPTNDAAGDKMEKHSSAKHQVTEQRRPIIGSAEVIKQKTSKEIQYNSSHETAYQSISEISGDIDKKCGQSHSIKPTMTDNPIHTIPINTQEDFYNQQSNQKKQVFSKMSSDLPVNLPKMEPAMVESQPGTTTLENTDTVSHGLLGTPPRLSHQQSELFKGLLIKQNNNETESVIKVNIGRVDVRAVMQQAPSPRQRKATPKPKLSLDDYLKQRDGGQR